MIKPATLWGLFKSCKDSEWLGDICRALGRQDVELDYGQEQMVNTIMQDSGWMDERVEEQRERWRDRQRKMRDKRDMSHVTLCHGDKVSSRDVTLHPSVRPSIHPNNKLVHTEPIPIARTRTRVKESGRVGSESVRGVANIIKKKGKDWWSAPDDDIRYPVGEDGEVVMLWTILHKCFGSGGWRKAITQAGEDAVRELFLTFRSEMAQGEMPKNAAAAFTQRLQTDLGVDFSKSLAESAKIKAANGV